MTKDPIAIVGAGLGGLVAARLLLDAGFDVAVYEQAKAFTRLGAGIHLGPNVVKILRRLQLDDRILSAGYEPDAWTNRDGVTGALISRLPLRDVSRSAYGAPYVTLRRGDLHEILATTVPLDRIRFGKRLVGLGDADGRVRLDFADGTAAEARLAIGADGVNSMVRETLLGASVPQFSGRVAYRGTASASRLDARVGDLTKWWGPGSHVMVYYVSQAKDEIYFIAVTSEDRWPHATSFVPGEVESLCRLYGDFHPDIQALFRAAPSVTKWAIFERDPLPLWSRGRIVLLGDACHPMKPHMGQGAAMAMEDATVLARCLGQYGAERFGQAFAAYARNRAPRAGEVQAESGKNRWLRDATDPGWVFGYDAVTAPLGLPD